MNLHVDRRAALTVALLGAVSIVLFVLLIGAFGGPRIQLGEPYRLTAVIGDTQGIAGGADVLVRGVEVGQVTAIDPRGSEAAVTFEVEGQAAPVGRDATVQIGQKTLLGEAYLNLEPGDPERAGAFTGGTAIPAANVRGTVQLDEALKPLVGAGGDHIQNMLGTFGRGAAARDTSERLSATVAGLSTLVAEIRNLTETLDGQEQDIAAGVQDSRTVLGELGRREAALRSLVADGRTTLSAVSSQNESLQAGMRELPPLLEAGEQTLADARPLVQDARPLLADLRSAGPRLTPALEDLRPAADDLRTLLSRLPAFADHALPFLDRALPIVNAARPVARGLAPSLANLVPIARYLEPRRNTIAAWFANTDDLGLNGDSKGKWARFFLFIEPGTGFGLPGTSENSGNAFRNNAYTKPDDAAHNEPHEPGDYPRLLPFEPKP
jgi:phospholipid/cholesterol/gamma-HCH transport system substrate-binding protein